MDDATLNTQDTSGAPAPVAQPAPAPVQAQAPPPQTTSPDLGAAASIPQEPTQNMPLQAQQNPNAGSGGVFERVLQILAGNPQQNAHYDPNTGNMVSTPVTSKASLAGHIVAAAITGMLRGMAAPPGPGHVAQAGNLALQGGIADQERQRAYMEQDYERQQQARLQQLQVGHLNAQTALDSANAQVAGMDSLEKGQQMNSEAVQQLAANGSIETDASGNPVTYTQSDILAKIKSGELNPADSIGMQYGGTLIDGKPTALYVVNKDPNAPVKISQQQYDLWTSQGVNVPKEVVGQSIPAKSFSAYSNQALVHSTGEATLQTLRHDAGNNKELLAKLPTDIDPNTPGMTTALRIYQQALRGSKGDVYGALEAVYQKNPQSGQILLNAFGGQDTIRDIANQHAADVKAAAASESADAEEKAREPYIQEEHKFQAGLVRETAALNKQAADSTARNLKADEMVTTEQNNRDADLNAIAGVAEQLRMAQGGNQQAYQDAVTRFAEHEVVAGGIKRFNETELKALGVNVGSWGRQLSTWADKGFTGKGAAPTIDEMQKVLALEAQQRQQLYNNHVNNINNNIRGGAAPQRTTQGGAAQPQTGAPPRPAGVPANAIWNQQGNGGKGAWQLPPQQ